MPAPTNNRKQFRENGTHITKRWGFQAERIHRMRKREEGGVRKRGGGCQEPATQQHSQTWNKKEKKRYMEIKKYKSSKAKGEWDNLS